MDYEFNMNDFNFLVNCVSDFFDWLMTLVMIYCKIPQIFIWFRGRKRRVTTDIYDVPSDAASQKRPHSHGATSI